MNYNYTTYILVSHPIETQQSMVSYRRDSMKKAKWRKERTHLSIAKIRLMIASQRGSKATRDWLQGLFCNFVSSYSSDYMRNGKIFLIKILAPTWPIALSLSFQCQRMAKIRHLLLPLTQQLTVEFPLPCQFLLNKRRLRRLISAQDYISAVDICRESWLYPSYWEEEDNEPN